MENDSKQQQQKRVGDPNETRRLRFVGRQAMRRITTDLRCFDCGRETVNSNGAVDVRRTSDGKVGFAGLASCGRIWLCPVCNAKVMARRAIEIGLALAWAQNSGYLLIWGSLTVRHNAGSDLRQLLEMQRAAWRGVVSSRFWRNANATETVSHAHTRACALGCTRKKDTVLSNRAGRVGYIRASELTIGVNGWHPHFHPLIVWRGSRAAGEAFAAAVVAEWVIQVGIAGGEAVADGGQQLKVLGGKVAFETLGDYVTKQTFDHSAIAMELVWSQNKTGWVTKGRAAATAPHWSLLAEIALGPGSHLQAVDRWQQLEEVISGHRMITWSRGLRDLAGVGLEVEDETLAAEEVGSADDSVCFITPDGWELLRDEPDHLALILGTLANSGWVGLRVILDTWEIPYFTLASTERESSTNGA